MLEKEKGIDAVVIATPDHTHAPITLAALQAASTCMSKAADAHGLRGPHDHRGRAPVQGADADGQPGPFHGVDASPEGVAG